MKDETKADAGAGVAIATILTTSLFLVSLGWAPASYYLSKWGDYWSGNTLVSSGVVFSIDQEADRARTDCMNRAAAKYGFSRGYVSDASSTSGHYDTYDCYALPWVKI